MNIYFRLELDKGETSPYDPACLEITRKGTNIVFTIIDGANRPTLTGSCEPEELFKLASVLCEEGN
jgi:hypothetical protein